MTNPLLRYFRRAELYLPLPSKGNWWPAGSIELPPTKEISILPMSGNDEIAMKTADGLLNGSSTADLIKSCCPNIKEPWATPVIDLDAIIISIRIASYGNQMDFGVTCPKCNHIDELAIDLRWVLDNITIPDYTTPVDLNGNLFMYIKPDDFDQVNKLNLEQFKQQRLIQALVASNLSEEEKTTKLQEGIQELGTLTSSRLSNSIDYFLTEDGTKVGDKQQIVEFIENADHSTFDKIFTSISTKAKEYSLPKIKTTCTQCNHGTEHDFIFEPSDFFVKSS